MKTSLLVKKICAVALCAAMLGGSAVTVLPAVSSTDSGIVANAAEYGNFEYWENDDGGITITGYTGRDTEVVIPSEINGKSVTSIGYRAFYGCSSLTSITIPDSVTSIGYRAFRGCDSLTSISIPDSVTSIGIGAFEQCTSLTSISIPDSVTSIGSVAFYGTAWYNNQPDGDVYAGKVYYTYKGTMPENTSVTIKEGTKGIANYAFSECSNLKSITIPDSVTSIGSLAFSGCSSLTSITIPDSVTSIGEGAFYGCSSLTSITIPDSVTSIGGGAFYKCTSLTSISIPDSVTSIGYRAFYGCSSLTSITIPDSVTSIGSGAFDGTAWYNNQPDGDVYAGKVYYTYKGTMPENTSVTIKEGTKGIADSAFRGCNSLTSITIPDSVTSIGGGAFYKCTSLTSISIPDSVTSIGERAFGYYYDDDYGDRKISLTIYGKTGSAAETYAKENGFEFVSTGTAIIWAEWVELNKTALSLEKGKTETLTATVTPDNAADKTVTWTTSDEKVATVEEGKLTAIGAGTATITATTANGKTATATVTVTEPVVDVTDVALNKTELSLETGTTETLTATVTPDNATDKTVTWTTSDEKVATVEEGKLTAIGAGTATITATTANGKTATATVTVTEPVVDVTDVALNKTELSLETGTTETLTATVTPDNATDKTVTWTTSNSSVAAVSNGKVTAVAAGTATITATTANGKTATATVTVTDPVPTVTDISKATVSGITNKTYTGKNITQSITVKLGDKTLKNGTDYSVAYKNNTNAGTATVTVTGKGNYNGKIEKTFTINKAASKISLAAQSKTYTGKTLAYSGKVTKSGSTGKITYTYYSDSACTKKVTPKAAGTYYVKATVAADSNYKAATSAAAKFTISKASIAKFTATLSSTSYTYTGAARKPAVTVKNGSTTLKNATDYSVTYSSNKAIGTAKVTIKGKGNYTGTITKTFKIVPKTATLKTVTSPKTKQLKATWAKDTTATGYQIQYSTNSKFTSGNKTKTITKNSTTSATLTGLTKGKTYYVKVRAYKTVGKTKVYGAYSAVKKVKIK